MAMTEDWKFDWKNRLGWLGCNVYVVDQAFNVQPFWGLLNPLNLVAVIKSVSKLSVNMSNDM